MKHIVIRLGVYILSIIWIFAGVIIADNMYAVTQQTYSGLTELYAFLAFWVGLSFLLLLLRSRMSVSMPVKPVLIASAVSLVISAVVAVLSFTPVFMRFYFGNLFFLLLLMTLIADLFDMASAAITKNHQS